MRENKQLFQIKWTDEVGVRQKSDFSEYELRGVYFSGYHYHLPIRYRLRTAGIPPCQVNAVPMFDRYPSRAEPGFSIPNQRVSPISSSHSLDNRRSASTCCERNENDFKKDPKHFSAKFVFEWNFPSTIIQKRL